MTFVHVVNEHENTINCIPNDFGPVWVFSVYLSYSFKERLRLEVVIRPGCEFAWFFYYLFDCVAKRVNDFIDGVIVFGPNCSLRLIVVDYAFD
jgi:hypothetical protein